MASPSRKATTLDRTVFVRFLPPSATIRRHALEDVFSQIGPIQKCSVVLPNRRSQPRDRDRDRGGEQEATADDDTGGVRKPASYGFIKYSSREDAEKALKEFQNHRLDLGDGEFVRLQVQQGSHAHGAKHDDNKPHRPSRDSDNTHSKAQTRLILRNLAFSARESHIRKAVEARFGPLTNVHLPLVPTSAEEPLPTAKKSPKLFHRGFCFVTFASAEDAKACLNASSISGEDQLVVAGRPVQVARTLNKTAYEHSKQQQTNEAGRSRGANVGRESHLRKRRNDWNDEQEDSTSEDDGSGEIDGQNDEQASQSDHDDSIESSSSTFNTNDSASEPESKRTASSSPSAVPTTDTSVAEKRTLFLRNLPFDTTRHDVFELFRTCGHIDSIYLVRDKTGLFRGTAFLSYQKQAAAERALAKAATNASASRGDAFVSQRESSLDTSLQQQDGVGAFMLKGRRVWVDVAVDKSTASTLAIDKKTDSVGKDRRNIYLKGEGRVGDTEESESDNWDNLPQPDQEKRQRAWSEKNTKLRSPLFFINPTRLSIRNLSKNVAESDLKRFCVEATMNGLETGRVSASDQVEHWKAKGDMTTREMLNRIQQVAGDDRRGASLIPAFDESNVKQFIPSVFIDRDFGNKQEGKSRGYGFVEFTHHLHALACLRELNNNTAYSKHAAGGNHALQQKKKRRQIAKRSASKGGDDVVQVPRLIVEFTVENLSKAKQQAEHRAQTASNLIKQKKEHRERSHDTAKPKRKSRGAAQRERKRRRKEDGDEDVQRDETREDSIRKTSDRPPPFDTTSKSKRDQKQVRSAPVKRRKVDQEETKFSRLVESYKKTFGDAARTAEAPSCVYAAKTGGKRWYE